MDVRGRGITPTPPEAAAEEIASDKIEGECLEVEVAEKMIFFGRGIGIPITPKA